MNLLKEISQNKNIKKPVIYGLQGLELSDEEKIFFSKSSPIGFILFSRNIKDKNQVKSLVKSLKELMGGEVLILIDQEGGRVARLKGGEWRDYPTARHFAEIYQNNQQQAKQDCYNNAALIAQDLTELGINVNCAPVLDIENSNTHEIIGDRAFGRNAAQIVDLASQVCQGFLDNDVYPVIKHIPGHGRATADSHLELPVVDADLFKLENTDFIPFKKLAHMKFAMTAHILYSKIDSKLPATISKKAIETIRNDIGFKNILMSDDLSMKALPKSFSYRTKASLEAGCDLVLHCNGDMKEMLEIDQNLPPISDSLAEKLHD
ncbi:MAG: beta-N-acetylhexosaminidase [Proteobacteria bacterium]|nr:beta-N-acetylhexosaminidase [Pseudomonadota bacterium]